MKTPRENPRDGVKNAVAGRGAKRRLAEGRGPKISEERERESELSRSREENNVDGDVGSISRAFQVPLVRVT